VQGQKNIPIGFSITRGTVSEYPDKENSLAAQPARTRRRSLDESAIPHEIEAF
jgi:hypothetical protein